ncbi:MAG: ribose-phosphate diphosphokinase [Candidatus Curtissbacteria bacterium]|nr:ribose-phosphate diphosphokinase [Candidatus Curtissbacteria bacterium]
MNSPKIFAGSSNPNLAKEISRRSKIPLGQIEIGRFSDTEIDVWVKDEVNNSDVFIIQSNSAPVNDNIIELALIADAVKRSGAHKITAVIPYLGYSRKEKQTRPGEPISAKVVADLITASGINKVVCIDLHADAIVGFFNVPVIYLSALEVLGDRIKKEKHKGLIVVSPDVGGVKRARNFATILNAPLAVIEKHRQVATRDKIEVLSISGEVTGDTAIIIDDVISTGGTIIESAHALKEKGVKEVIVCATHGVFAGNAFENLGKSEIDKIFVTDTIAKDIKSSKIEQVTVAGLIADCLKKEI